MTEKAKEKKLTPAQLKGIEALLTTGKVTEAARAAGVAPQTFYRWRKQPHFRKALQEAEAQAVASLSAALAALGSKAASALSDALDAKDLRLRVRAADIVLGRLLQLRELVELEERIERLEALANGEAIDEAA